MKIFLIKIVIHFEFLKNNNIKNNLKKYLYNLLNVFYKFLLYI